MPPGTNADTDLGAAAAEPRLLGHRLCLDFTNTIDPRHGVHRRELLVSYSDLARWAGHAGAAAADDVSRLLDEARRHPAMAEMAFQAARTLREELYQIFSRIAAGMRPEPGDVEALARAHGIAMANVLIVPSATGYQWGWNQHPCQLEQMLWPVARDAAELLTTGRLERIRECPGSGSCGWLFYDTSRNGKRRWCSMEGCGNRAKGRRHYQRQCHTTASEPILQT